MAPANHFCISKSKVKKSKFSVTSFFNVVFFFGTSVEFTKCETVLACGKCVSINVFIFGLIYLIQSAVCYGVTKASTSYRC